MFFSPSGYLNANREDGTDQYIYSPFDTPWAVWRLYHRLRPKVLVIVKHDIWPNQVWIAKLMKIPVIIINASLSKSSSRLKWWSKWFHAALYRDVNRIFTISEKDSENFLYILDKKRNAITKYDNFGNFMKSIKAEDIKTYSEGISDDNPLFNDEEAAKNGPYGGLIAHPLFLTPIGFWFTGDGGPGSWVKTPGAINPGQKIEFYEPIRVGDVISQKSKFFDKWIKRGKRYLTYESEYYKQEKKLVAKWWITLIIPKSKENMSHQF